ncbi:MAG: hypothetical protein MUE81_08875 [Thermoflexibacter sp.]|jgi:hypothetical protein|nr:hypothetical protein [Thermoflexibacter sp.]
MRNTRLRRKYGVGLGYIVDYTANAKAEKTQKLISDIVGISNEVGGVFQAFRESNNQAELQAMQEKTNRTRLENEKQLALLISQQNALNQNNIQQKAITDNSNNRLLIGTMVAGSLFLLGALFYVALKD